MNVICLEDDAFYAIIDKVVEHINKTTGSKEDQWLTTEQAMEKLHITSKTTLQKLRNEGSIRFSQPVKKIILYDSDSIQEYLNKHAQNTF